MGPQDAPAIILVAGLGCQLTLWPDSFCQQLIDQGLRVIRFDNRDIGYSADVNRHVRVSMPLAFIRAKLRLPIPSNYTMHDMADDLIGLMDALNIKQAHVAGIQWAA